ncbi:MAG TPA: cupredoxin domain-containing protein [Chlorobaculum sp.]|nr:cupredoxin domain-containing protein [Chlorobaculum sp.]
MKHTKPYIAALFALALACPARAAEKTPPVSNTATITAVYTKAGDINPKNFTVPAGQKVRFRINPQDSGSGCMKDIMVQGLWNKPELLVKDKPIVMEFTPLKPGAYKITCSMGESRGVINVK